ncbi:MAG TPA: TonB-dependent receptor [Thermoanaerobaculia bacterium]|nr:TonB-dependent receptor [Thermoanaerobaculia bacterium]
MRKRFASLFFLALFAMPLPAQTPNTAALIVAVVDQSGAVVPDARVSVVNNATGATRDIMSGSDGSASISALPLTGTYTISVSKEGFGDEQRNNITLRSGETATLKVTLLVGSEAAGVTVYGTAEGVRADPQIGRRFDADVINELPILGRKITSIPLLNSAFRQGKGTGDLFVNATYFITGAGSRRTTTYTLDGATNDEGWGRQTMIATVPLGAVEEVTVLSNAFSSEYGWTAGPAVNVVTKSGTNSLSGDALYMFRPGSWQADTFSTSGYCPPSVDSCSTPATLQNVNPVDIPDELNQYSVSIGGPLIKDRTFFFAAGDYTRQDRTTFLSSSLPAFVLPADGNLAYTGHYRQTLFNGRLDHTLTPSNTLMVRTNIDRMSDDNPQDAVGGTNAPSVARRYSRSSWTAQLNETAVLSADLLNEARFAFLNGDPVTKWEAQTPSTTYTRAGSVPFTIGQSRESDLHGRQLQLADTLSWSRNNHYLRFGASVSRHTSGGAGNEPGLATLGTFTFRNTTTAPFGQLTLADVQQYTQPISFGIDSYELSQWLYTGFVQDSVHWRDVTVDLGLRYDRQTLTDDKNNFAPRLGFGWHPFGDARTAVRGGYGVYYTQIRSNAVAGYLVNGLDGLTTYTATPGQLGFPTCLTGACLPLSFDPRTLPASQLPARDIVIRAGRADFYREQFARYGLNFDLLPNYPDELVNPRSEVMSIGAERELLKGLFIGADFVHQHWSDLDRTVDLNAPSAFDRTAPGQTRTVAQANATRPILPVAGGVRQVNVLMNLGEADYDGLQTQVTYRGISKLYAALSYTLSKSTNTFEPDGNGIGSNQSIISRLGEEERGPSVVDQRHRAVLTLTYDLPFNISVGTVAQYASARPFSATTGIDNNGDGANNDRPVVNGEVIKKSAFRGTATSDVAAFIEGRLFQSSFGSVMLRLEGFNLLNHGNYLGRGQTVYGDAATPNPTFGQLVAAGSATNALPAFANVDPPRMFQAQVRFIF